MKNNKQLKKEILEKVREFYKSQPKEKFIPNKTRVNYAGRIYNEKELMNLVSASLDFKLTAGEYAKKFEEKFAKLLGIKYCLLTNSGSSANLLAVTVLTSPKLGERRLKAGDEIITTACGFPTTLNPILQNGLVPVFIDVDLGTYNIQTDKIEKIITKKTKAIFIAHTLGNPANLTKLKKIAKKYSLWLIEDNCDALGSKYNGKYTGTFGDIATFSFYPAHHITMGEGGALVTNNLLLKRIVASFRDWGRDCWCEPGKDNTCGNRFKMKFGKLPFGYDHKYVYSHIGYNLKITDMQAAIGLAQLEKLPLFIKKRKDNFSKINNFLKKYEKYFILPKVDKNADPSWFGFPILVKEESPFTKNEIVEFLEKNNIATRMLFGGNLLNQPAYQNIKFKTADGLENTDIVMNNLFWIGVYLGITKEKLNYIFRIFVDFLKKYDK